jgi:hypothetical protein
LFENSFPLTCHRYDGFLSHRERKQDLKRLSSSFSLWEKAGMRAISAVWRVFKQFLRGVCSEDTDF